MNSLIFRWFEGYFLLSNKVKTFDDPNATRTANFLTPKGG